MITKQLIQSISELTPVDYGVYQIRLPLPFALDHINVYLIEDSDGWILVDTGIRSECSQSILKSIIDQLPKTKPLKAVLATHTHVDHIGAAGWICEKWQVPLWVTKSEYEGLQHFLGMDPKNDADLAKKLDNFYHSGGIPEAKYKQIIRGLLNFQKAFYPLPNEFVCLQEGAIKINNENWQIFINDGHTVAHASLYNPSRRILISGDQVLARISSNVSVRFNDDNGNPISTWISGLERLKLLPDTTLVLPAHEQSMTNLHERVDQLIEGYLENSEKILHYCQTPCTAEEMLRALFPRELSPLDHHLAYGETLAYINYQLAKKNIQKLGNESDIQLYKVVL
ncbi:MAG: putative metallo-hydrolase YflN [Marinobacterium sp. xm-d-530]|nr:MAG: putative metallo-hydrolase YflN [Marinobacterium sp. xm-d-530]